MSKFCTNCGTMLDNDDRFCAKCGKLQALDFAAAESVPGIDLTPTTDSNYITQKTSPAFNQGEIPSANESAEAKKRISVPTLIRNSVLLAVALILFAFSFAPIFKEEIPRQDVALEISPIDQIVFLFDSMKTETLDDIKDSRLFDEWEMLDEEIEDEYDKDREELTPRGKKLLKKFLLLSYRLSLQNEDYITGLSEILPAIVSLVYILLTLAFLVFATLNFVSSFELLKKIKEKIYSYTLKMLAALPGFILVLYSTMFVFYGSKNAAMGWGGVINLIISLVAVITVVILAFVFKWHKKKFNIPLRSVAIVVSILVICMTLTPVMTSTLRATFDGRDSKSTVEVPVYATIFEEFAFNEEEWDTLTNLRDYDKKYIRQFVRVGIEDIEDYSKSEIKDGVADGIHMQALAFGLSIEASDFAIEALSLVPLLYFAITIFASMILQQNLRCFMDGTYSRVQATVGKIVSLVMAGLTLAVIIATFACLANAVYYYAPKEYSIYFGAGIIFVMIFAVANCALPSEKK